MGVGAGLYMYVVVVRKFTFAISSPDEFLFWFSFTSFLLWLDSAEVSACQWSVFYRARITLFCCTAGLSNRQYSSRCRVLQGQGPPSSQRGSVVNIRLWMQSYWIITKCITKLLRQVACHIVNTCVSVGLACIALGRYQKFVMILREGPRKCGV